jgi:hypothetical protein
MREVRNSYRISVGNSEVKRSRGRHKLGRKNNIKVDLKELRCEGVELINLAQDRDRWNALVNTVITSVFHKR